MKKSSIVLKKKNSSFLTKNFGREVIIINKNEIFFFILNRIFFNVFFSLEERILRAIKFTEKKSFLIFES